MPILSPELVEITARHQVYLERLKAGNRKEFEKVVRAMDRAIRDIMGQLPDTPTQAQADAAIARIGQAIAVVLDGYIAQHIAELGELAIYEAGFQARAIGEVIEGRAVAIVAPSNTVINRALDSSPMSVRDARAGLTVLEVARQFSANQVARIENRIRLGYFEGKTTTQLIKEIRGLASLRFQDGELAQVAKSAQIMAADTFQFASSIGKQATLEANEITEYEWVSVLDSRTSAQCRSLDGRRFTVGKGPLPPIHPNCLPGDSLVSAGCDITGVSKRWFDGELVTVKTASGNVLSCTPNHPVLTASGWVAASLINESHEVISSRGRKSVGRVNAENDNGVAAISDVAESFFASSGVVAVPVPVAAPHFHGDGAGSEVAIIGANGSLLAESNAPGFKHFGKPAFVSGDSLASRYGSLNPFVVCYDSASGGVMGCLSKRFYLLRSRLGHSRKLLLASVARLKSRLFDYRSCCVYGADTKLFDSSEANPGIEKTDDFSSVDALGGKFRFRFYRDAASLKDSMSNALGDTDLSSSIADGNSAFDVYRDKVVSVSLSSFSGHVYNLETVDGYYVANGIVTHNCRSSVVPVLPNSFDPITAAATRNAEGGAVDADLTYYDWLKTQPTAFVEDVLGKDRAKLLLEGGLSAEKFAALQLNRNFQPLTLEEMKKKEPLAFERAGL